MYNKIVKFLNVLFIICATDSDIFFRFMFYVFDNVNNVGVKIKSKSCCNVNRSCVQYVSFQTSF